MDLTVRSAAHRIPYTLHTDTQLNYVRLCINVRFAREWGNERFRGVIGTTDRKGWNKNDTRMHGEMETKEGNGVDGEKMESRADISARDKMQRKTEKRGIPTNESWMQREKCLHRCTRLLR